MNGCARARRPAAEEVQALFAEEVRQAEAQARLGAEVAALKDKPMDWLKAGPGKETAAKPGWSALAKPRAGGDKPTPLLLDPAVQTFLRTLLSALEAYPEARAAVAKVLTAREGKNFTALHGQRA